MGAWDDTIFGNDTALDWLGDLEDGGGADRVRETLEAALADEEYVEAPAGEEALAAAEVVAAAAGRPTSDDGEAARAVAWARDHPDAGDAELVALARRAVERITGEGSELHELWHENEGQGDEWDRVVAKLRERLAAV
jgi:hypothetical protein